MKVVFATKPDADPGNVAGLERDAAGDNSGYEDEEEEEDQVRPPLEEDPDLCAQVLPGGPRGHGHESGRAEPLPAEGRVLGGDADSMKLTLRQSEKWT